MKWASFRFYAELNDFLSPRRKEEVVKVSFQGRQSVKHLIESLHVPHTEVGEMRVNGEAVDFSYLVQDGDQVQVYPAPNGYPAGEGEGAYEEMPGWPLFILDNHLGKLARYLRMLGFDSLYRNDYQDEELAEVAEQENRILLTRDRGLLMRKTIQHGYCVRAKDPKQQLAEVARRFDLFDRIEPFQRCLRCNSPLCRVSKEAVLHRLQPLTRKYYHEFHLCPMCDQVYWRGSHYEKMEGFLRGVREGGIDGEP